MKRLFLVTIIIFFSLSAYFLNESRKMGEAKLELMKQLEVAVRANGKLTQENNQLYNRLNTYVYHIAVLQDEVFHLKEDKKTLEVALRQKPLCEIIDEAPIYEPQIIVKSETKLVRELPLFSVHTFLGYGVKSVSIRTDGTNVYGEPKKGMIGGFSITTHPFRNSTPWNRISIGGGVIGAESIFLQTSFDF